MDDTSLSQNELDAITYDERYVKDYTLDDNRIEEHLPLDHGKHLLNPTANLGQLDLLPYELLGIILMQVDMQCLTDFRHVNQRAMYIIDSMPPYAALIKHAPNSIRGCLGVGTAKSMSCQKLYKNLIDFRCDHCGKYGKYIHLITCRRLCSGCALNIWKFFPLSMHEVEMIFGLTPAQIQSLPQMRNRPGCYSGTHKNIASVNTFYDWDSAKAAAIVAHGSKQAMDTHLSQAARERSERWEKDFADWECSTKKSPPPRVTSVVDTLSSLATSPRHFTALIRFPYLNVSQKKLEWGFWCKRCLQNSPAKDADRHPIYPLGCHEFNAETFKEHFARKHKINPS